MHITDTPIYRKAFEQYLRKGIPIEISIKALIKAATLHETTYYIWRTAGDDKVRPEHAANEGRIFAWNNPPNTGHPGEATNCRCTAEPYDGMPPEPGLESSILDVFLLAIMLALLLRAPLLAVAWRVWTLTQGADKVIKFAKYKTPERWAKQLEAGKWTPDKINNVIRRGEQYPAINKTTHPNRPATIYKLGDDFVVVDDATKEIIQVSRDGFKPPYVD